MHTVVVPILLGRGIRLWDGLEGLEKNYEVEATLFAQRRVARSIARPESDAGNVDTGMATTSALTRATSRSSTMRARHPSWRRGELFGRPVFEFDRHAGRHQRTRLLDESEYQEALLDQGHDRAAAGGVRSIGPGDLAQCVGVCPHRTEEG